MASSIGVERFTLGGITAVALACGAVAGCSWQGSRSSVTAEAGELSEEQRKIEYVYYVNQLVPCIRALRFRVDAVPDMEEFLSQVPTLAWSPINALTFRASAQEIAQIRSICPPNPVGSHTIPLPIREVAVTGRQLSRSIGG